MGKRPAYKTSTRRDADGTFTIQVVAYPVGGDPKSQGTAVFTLSGCATRSKGLVVAQKWIDNDIKSYKTQGKSWNDIIQSDEYKALTAQSSPVPEPEDSTPTPYGVVRGPKSAIEYVRQLIADDVALGAEVRND